MSVAFIYSSSSQRGIWHASAAFLLRLELDCSVGERRLGEQSSRGGGGGGQGWEGASQWVGASLWKFEEDLPSAPGERIGLSWEGLGSPKIYVYF